jgi:hypothetical protein
VDGVFTHRKWGELIDDKLVENEVNSMVDGRFIEPSQLGL